ncbi:MAG: DUF3883 domain-containing protein [bacterium]|nr:DUF3883 domain-containing protein [bacterium]
MKEDDQKEFNDLKKKRKDWLTSNKINHFDMSTLLAGNYKNPAHFVYELLQNAEDAESGLINFKLFTDKLEVINDGKDFTLRDVDSITSIGNSSKENLSNQYGKFGLGFKSVFSVTHLPEVFSGYFHFKIYDFVGIDDNLEQSSRYKGAKFILPFDRQRVGAFKKIREELDRLGLITMLFLKKIEEISYEIESGESRKYKKQENVIFNGKAEIITMLSDESREQYAYLLFSRSSTTINGKNVEIAYQINKNFEQTIEFIEDKNSKIFVLFATEKESFLKFIVQAPFNTTPNRENIDFSQNENNDIVQEIVELVTESIKTVKNERKLTTSFMNILPLESEIIIDDKYFISSKIHDAIIDLFTDGEDYIIAEGNKYVNPQAAIFGTEDLIDLLSSDDLKFLFGKSNWVNKEISDKDTTRNIYNFYRNELHIFQINFEDFIDRIDEEFLCKKDDAWLTKFYLKLKKHNYFKDHLENKPIIRLENNTHVPAFENGQPFVYLPSDGESSYPTIKRCLLDNKEVLKFFEDLGIKRPDKIAEIRDYVVKKYEHQCKITTLKEQLDYIADIEKILNVFNDEQYKGTKEYINLLERLKETNIVKAYRFSDGNFCLKKAREVYFESDELKKYFEGSNNAYFVGLLNSPYDKFNRDQVGEFFRVLGCNDSPIIKKEPVVNFNNKEGSYDWSYDGLKSFLNNLSKEKSLILWKFLILKLNKKTDFRACRCYTHYGPKREYNNSEFLLLLQNEKWLYNKVGELKKPSEITINDLNDEYEKGDNFDELTEIVKFGCDEIEKARETLKRVNLKVVSNEDYEELCELRAEKVARQKNLVENDNVSKGIEEIAKNYIYDSNCKIIKSSDSDRLTLRGGPENISSAGGRGRRKAGSTGELSVYNYLRDEYGFEHVHWVSSYAKTEGVNPDGDDEKYPYDIFYDNNGVTKYVEVKATPEKSMNFFKISAREHAFGIENNSNYELYLVDNCGVEPHIRGPFSILYDNFRQQVDRYIYEFKIGE